LNTDKRREQAVQMILEPPYSGWLRTGSRSWLRRSSWFRSASYRRRSAISFGSLGIRARGPASLRLLQLRLGSRFWIDAARLHPAARAAAASGTAACAE